MAQLQRNPRQLIANQLFANLKVVRDCEEYNEARHQSDRVEPRNAEAFENRTQDRESRCQSSRLQRDLCESDYRPHHGASIFRSQSRGEENGRRSAKEYHRYIRIIPHAAILFFLLWCSPIEAQTPFIDGPFNLAVGDEDPDLIVVRENYDPVSRIQSIYVRSHDGTMDREIISGTLTVEGAFVTSVLTDHQSLKETDRIWGLDGVAYGLGRGLEGDVSQTEPFVGSDDDLITTTGESVRFWLSTEADIDDFRVLIRYPDEHEAAHLQIVLWHLRGRDEEGYPVTTPGRNGATGGIVVGNASQQDLCPDDGDYGEITSVGRIRLKTEDLDIREGILNLGSVDHRGGVLGPATFHIENFLNGIDIDMDNEPDSNGLVSPVPNHGSLNQLRAFASDLENENGDLISNERGQIFGIPEVIANGALGQSLYGLTVPANTPVGEYLGYLLVWEDNDQSNDLSEGEPSDSVQLRVVVEPQLSSDAGSTIEDMTMPIDAGEQMDMQVDASIIDDQDTRPIMEQGVIDASLFDTGADDIISGDDGMRDAILSHDALSANDIDSGDLSTSVTLDALGSDMNSAADAPQSVHNESWTGRPSGGAFQCRASEHNSAGGLIGLMVLFLLARRRT